MSEFPRVKVIVKELSSVFAIFALIIGILFIIGQVAKYQMEKYQLRSARYEAKQALAELAARQMQYFVEHKTYTTNLSDLDMPALTENGKYTLVIISADGRSYDLRADATGSQVDDEDCLNFTLDSQGTKNATGPMGAECW